MTSVVRFLSLLGSSANSEDGFCSILELDQAKILLDCGLPSSYTSFFVNASFLGTSQKGKAHGNALKHIEFIKA